MTENKNKFLAPILLLSIAMIFFSVPGAEAKTRRAMTLTLEKEVAAGELQVKMSGAITPAKAGVKVKIFQKLGAKKSFKKIAAVRTDANGQYSYSAEPNSAVTSIQATAKVSGKKLRRTAAYALESMTLTDITILSPHMSDADIDNIPEAFSNSAASPWGFTHVGIDFIPTRNLVPFQAVIDGEITVFSCGENPLPMGWHCGFCIEQGEFTACYNFEVFSDSDDLGASQQANVFFAEGDQVDAGEILGYLVQGGESAHLDFGVIPSTGGNRSCPQPYFTTEAYDSIMGLIHADHPTWEMCYE
jgi:hypothetical protein